MFDLIGYLALGLNLYSMSVRGEYKLRIFSAIANITYVFYGILIDSLPLILGCSIAVVLHAFRLYKLSKVKKIEIIH